MRRHQRQRCCLYGFRLDSKRGEATVVRRIAFIGGLMLGSGLSALALGTVLIYLFTGKMIAFVYTREGGFQVKLIDLADELHIERLHEAPGRAA